MYKLEISDMAKTHIAEFKKSDIQSFKKVSKLLEELIEHPKTGTGKPEILKGKLSDYWSRKINKKDRLVYRIDDKLIEVFILRAKGHYYDK